MYKLGSVKVWRQRTLLAKRKCLKFVVGQAAYGLPGGSDGKESTCKSGYLGLIPGLGRSLGGEHGNPLECSYLGNPMERRARWATVHGVAKKSDTTKHIARTHHTHKLLVEWFENCHWKIRGRTESELSWLCYQWLCSLLHLAQSWVMVAASLADGLECMWGTNVSSSNRTCAFWSHTLDPTIIERPKNNMRTWHNLHRLNSP